MTVCLFCVSVGFALATGAGPGHLDYAGVTDEEGEVQRRYLNPVMLGLSPSSGLCVSLPRDCGLGLELTLEMSSVTDR